MSSRLDRLLLLLDLGSTASIRKSAAEQLGEVQKLYPHELNNLLNKVHAYLMSSQWETRVAASQAIASIISNIPAWKPIGRQGGSDETSDIIEGQTTLKLANFDLCKVLAQGVQLTTRDHRVFDQTINSDGVIDSTVLAGQKKLLNKKLGLDIPDLNNNNDKDADGNEDDNNNNRKEGGEEDDLVNENDLIPEPSMAVSDVVNVKEFVEETFGDTTENNNVQIRKRKLDDGATEPSAKLIKMEDETRQSTLTEAEETSSTDWSLANFCNLLANNLFEAVWERRHGAALGLKVLIKQHGKSAGRSQRLWAHQMETANSLWLQDLCVRLICVLSLDRLGDYLTDEVIAPVRESCSQVLGVVCLHLEQDVIVDIVNALLQLLSNDHNIWEVKHGGLLGIKYILATRQDLSSSLLQRVLSHIYNGLLDPSDDVRSVAASSLLPVVEELVKLQPEQVNNIINSLWLTLRDLDELSSSTNSIMKLISLLVSHPSIYQIWKTSSLSQLVPLLYPFISHNITSVRLASLTTVNILLSKSLAGGREDVAKATTFSHDSNINQIKSCAKQKISTDTSDTNDLTLNNISWIEPLLYDLVRLIFQRSLLENDQATLSCLQQVWDNLLQSCSSEMLVKYTGHCFKHWCCLLMQPDNLHYDNESLINVNPNRISLFRYIGGISNVVDSSLEKDEVVIRARMTASSLLGKYCYKVSNKSLSIEKSDPQLSQNSTQQPQQNAQQSNFQQLDQTQQLLQQQSQETNFQQQTTQQTQQQPLQQQPSQNNYNTTTAATELGQLVCMFLSSKSFIQRFVASNIVYYWAVKATANSVKCSCPTSTIDQLKTCLSDPVYYDELAFTFTRLQAETKVFLSTLHSWDIKLGGTLDDISTLLTLEKIHLICKTVSQQEVKGIKVHLNPQTYTQFRKLQCNLVSSLEACSQTKNELTNRVQCSIASVLIELDELKGLFNPTIRPLMHSVKTEYNFQLQQKSGLTLSKLVALVRNITPCPNVKVVKNLVNMLVLDNKLKPSTEENSDSATKYDDILVLKTRKEVNSIKTRRPYRKQINANNNATDNKDVPKLNNPDVEDIPENADVEARQLQERQDHIQCRGMMMTLSSIVSLAGPHLISYAPSLYSLIFDTLHHSPLLKSKNTHPKTTAPSNEHTKNEDLQELVRCLQVLNTVIPTFHASLTPQLISHFPHLLACLSNQHSIIRHLASRCLATISRIETDVTMDTVVLDKLVCHLEQSLNDYERMGAVEAISLVIEALDIQVVPYIVSLVLSLLCAMSDCVGNIRLVATYSFAVLVRLMPLDNTGTNRHSVKEETAPSDKTENEDLTNNTAENASCEKKNFKNEIVSTDKSGFMDEKVNEITMKSEKDSARIQVLDNGVTRNYALALASSEEAVEAKKRKDRSFLEQLLNPRLIEQFVVPIPLNVQLRKYQQDGINWLSFLSRYRLHGILCDDMGLGKTLQSLCILISDHYTRDLMASKNGSSEKTPPSIVITPPTLTSHWLFEVEKVMSCDIIKPLHYVGIPLERIRLQNQIGTCNLILASYDVVRNDIDFLSKIKWNYCILDEGHIIKNNKTKMSKAIKQLQSQHRLILSGTPIQNNVLELWSLFDFLMPGFLGEERQFQATFGRPILLSRDSKSSSKEQEAGALALEALHRQVLPFMLRRLKEDVLKDLPPKIMQDYYCDLSPLQVQLYEDFSRIKKESIQNDDEGDVDTKDDDKDDDNDGDKDGDKDGESNKGDNSKKKEKVSHIFQALQYLRKVCNHPSLAMQRLPSKLKNVPNIHDISHATKLVTLKQLLMDCGIGLNNNNSSSDQSSSSSSFDVTTSVVSQHRVILFCQMKIMLDIIERDLFKSHMPSVSYMRLDGSVPASQRHTIVHRFNNDPSIDVLLLSTQVGGLGLNLTGADTVIFYDHDWNPMKDLQAMDRAHRIGQKKVVTVYRLITRGTLEEKIMGLQRFKLNIAQSVINQDNHSLRSMGSNQLLDLFCLGNKSSASSNVGASTSSAESTMGLVVGEGSGKDKKGLKCVMEDIGQLWDSKQYDEEYDLDNYVNSFAK